MDGEDGEGERGSDRGGKNVTVWSASLPSQHFYGTHAHLTVLMALIFMINFETVKV